MDSHGFKWNISKLPVISCVSGSVNESYLWDNEPFNDLCVDLSDGAGEANLKI